MSNGKKIPERFGSSFPSLCKFRGVLCGVLFDSAGSAQVVVSTATAKPTTGEGAGVGEGMVPLQFLFLYKPFFRRT